MTSNLKFLLGFVKLIFMTTGDRYNTFWPRFGAGFLDSAALAPLAWFDQVLWNYSSSSGALLSWSLAYQVMGLLYSVGLVFLFGQTLGKMATGVVVLDSNGRKLTLMQAVLRDVVQGVLVPVFIVLVGNNVLAGRLENRGLGDTDYLMWFAVILMIWGILELITMLFNSRRRAIHDLIAGTVVVRQPVEERRVGYRKLRWLLGAFLILSFVVPHVLPENNMETGKPKSDSSKASNPEAPNH